MKVCYWIIWPVVSLVLLNVPPHPWYFIGYLTFVGWWLCFVMAVIGKVANRWYRPRHLIYKALEEKPTVDRLELIRDHALPPRVVSQVLEEWREKSLVREEGDRYHITRAGQIELQRKFGEA